MNLKQDFLAALRSGEDERSLLPLVQRYQAQGVSPEETYDVLEQIWRELGFDQHLGGGPMRDELEFVMEKVWFQGSNIR